jgi:hypothetical protein
MAGYGPNETSWLGCRRVRSLGQSGLRQASLGMLPAPLPPIWPHVGADRPAFGADHPPAADESHRLLFRDTRNVQFGVWTTCAC